MTEENNNNEINLEAILTKIQSLETMLLLTRTELKTTQVELQQSQEYINRTLVGSVSAFAMPDVPEGWLICDGQAVSRSVYPRLFAAISTIYGEGDGSTTFNLPDMRGLFIRGHDPIGKNDSKREFASYQDDQIQSHSHTDSGHNHSGSIGLDGNHSHSASTGSAGSHSHDGKTSSEGNHIHYLQTGNNEYFMLYKTNVGNDYTNPTGGRSNVYGKVCLSTDASGSHSHFLSINSANSHTHSISVNSAGSHTHSVSINDGQANLSNPINARHGSETRVKNIALIYCIKC